MGIILLILRELGSTMATLNEFVLNSHPTKQLSSSSKVDPKPYIDIDSIPDELLLEILQRLPQDLIHRCKCISKHWKELISSDGFIKSYIQYNTCLANSRPSFALFYQCCITNPFRFGPPMFKRFQFEFLENSALLSGVGLNSLPFGLSAPETNVLSSSNGLVLCSRLSHFARSFREEPYYAFNSFTKKWFRLGKRFSALSQFPNSLQEHYYVFNPLTKQYVRLETSVSLDGLCTPLGSSSTHIGFLSKSTNSGCSFRVVRVPCPYIPNEYLRFQIYNSELRQWRELVFEKLPYDRYFSVTSLETLEGEAVSCSGLLHWVNKRGDIFVYDPYYDINKYVILSLPNTSYLGITKRTIGVCKGRLRYFERCLENYAVWELEDYDTGKWSLVVEFCLDQMDIKRYWSYHKDSLPFAFHPFDDNIVFVQLLGPGQIVSCNLRKKKLLTVCNIDPKSWKECIFPIILPWWPFPLSQN